MQNTFEKVVRSVDDEVQAKRQCLTWPNETIYDANTIKKR